MFKRLISLLLPLMAVLYVHAQQCYVFIGSYNSDKSKNGIYVYSMDMATGKLSFVSAVNNVLNPAFVTIHPNGKFLYACTDAKTPNAGSVSSYSIDAENGMLHFINSQKSGGDNPVYVSIDHTGKWLLNANYSGGSAAIFSLSKDGSIQPAKQVLPFTDSSINKQRQEQSHIHSAFYSPGNKYAFFPDLGADKIRRFAFVANSAEPLKKAKEPFITTTPGSGPRHLAFLPAKQIIYCVTEMTGAIEVFKGYSKSKKIQRIFTHPANSVDTFGAADIHISPDGKFLYASNRGTENNIAIFSIKKDGTLQTVGYEPSGGNHPRNFGLTPNGKFVLVANMNSGNIAVFKRDAATGLLHNTRQDIRVENPSCVMVRNY